MTSRLFRTLVILNLVLAAALALSAVVAFQAKAQELMRPVTRQAITTSTTETSAIMLSTDWIDAIRVTCAAQPCHVAWMVTPWTTGASAPVYLPSGEPAVFRLGRTPGGAETGTVIGVIADGAGTLHVEELSR